MDLVLHRHYALIRLVVNSSPKPCMQAPVIVGAKSSYHFPILPFFHYGPLIRIIVTSKDLTFKQHLDLKSFLLLRQNLIVPYLQAH